MEAAQTSNASGDLTGETATVNAEGNVVIEEPDCIVDPDEATVLFRDDTGALVGVANGENDVTIRSTDRRVVVEGSDIYDEDESLTVLSSTGIDCGDPDDDDGFDDELLLLLLLEDADSNDDNDKNDNDNNGNNNNDNDDNDDNDGIDDDEDRDDDGDGVSATADENGAEASTPGPWRGRAATRTSCPPKRACRPTW